MPHLAFLTRDENDNSPTLSEAYCGQAAWLALRVVDRLRPERLAEPDASAFQYHWRMVERYVQELPEDPDGEAAYLLGILEAAAKLHEDRNDLTLRKLVNALSAYAAARRNLAYHDEAADLLETAVVLGGRPQLGAAEPGLLG